VVGRGARRHLSIVPRAADVDADRALH
jgi:hypothetical protein